MAVNGHSTIIHDDKQCCYSVLPADACDDDDNERLHLSAANVDASSFAQTSFNCVSVLLGLGMLASPYAVQKAGWSIFFIGLVCVPLVYFYTAVLLKRCLDKYVELRSYEDISEKAFGKKGLIVFTFFFYLEVYAGLVSYGVSIGDNLVQIVANEMGGSGGGIWANRWVLTGIAMVVVMPTAWIRNIRALSMISFGSTISAVLVIFAVVWLAVSHDVAFSDSHLVAARLGWLPMSTSIYLFNFSGHGILPGIYLSMQDKTKFTKAITVSFTLATICYTGLGFLGALVFGDAIESEVTLNLPSQYIASRVALWLTVILSITKFALMLSPLSLAADKSLPWCSTKKNEALVAIIARSCLTISIFLVALIFPYFSYMLSLIGATLCVTISVIFPCIFYLKLMGNSLSRFETLICVGLMILSFFVGIICTIVSIRNYLVNHTIIT